MVIVALKVLVAVVAWTGTLSRRKASAIPQVARRAETCTAVRSIFTARLASKYGYSISEKAFVRVNHDTNCIRSSGCTQRQRRARAEAWRAQPRATWPDPGLIGHSHGHGVVVGGGSRRSLRRNPSIDCQGLLRAIAGAGHRVGAHGVAPVGGAGGIGKHLIGDRIAAAGEQAGGRGATRGGARVQPDIVGRRVGALYVDGRGRVGVCGQNALGAE